MKKNLQQYSSKPLIRKEGGTLVQQEQMKNHILILPELEALIPPLLADESAQLEANLLKEGCREPLLIWHTTGQQIGRQDADPVYVLIDGHNRYGICRRHGIDFKISIREFSDLATVREFMIDNQLGRRNLTPEQMSYLRGQKYLAMKKKGGRTKADESSENATSDQGYQRTADVLAEQFQVSPRTILTDARVAQGLDRLTPELKKEVLSRQVKVNKKELAALGERRAPTEPIASPEALTAALQPKPNKKTVPQRADLISPIPEKINQISAHMQRLTYPSSTLPETCRSLIADLTELLALLQTPEKAS